MGPMAAIELQETRVEGSVLVATVRLCANHSGLTLEQAIGKLKHSHLQLVAMIAQDLRASGAPKRATQPLDGLKLSAEARDPDFFNIPSNFRQATVAVFDAQERALVERGADPL